VNAVFRWVSARHLFHEWGRSLLTLLGVALGVGVFVSIRLANHSALASFSHSVDAVAGRANLQVSAGGEGLDEKLFPAVRHAPGVRAAAPIVQVDVLAAPRRTAGARLPAAVEPGSRGAWTEALLVLGVEPFFEAPLGRAKFGAGAAGAGGVPTDSAAAAFLGDARAVAITRVLAERHHLAPGDTLEVLASGVPVDLRVRWITDSPALGQAYGGNVALVDIATAQELFHRAGRLDRIDLVVDPAHRDAIAARLVAALPSGTQVGPPGMRTRQVENMVSAFALNLTALSFIAVFVAAFLIFNAVGMAVLRRRGEIGILRALGATSGDVMRLFLAEGAVLGLAGGALGLLFGTLLARATLGAVSRTLTDLYLLGQARELTLDPATYAAGLGIGLVVALAASLAPALEAAGVPPAITLRQGQLIEARRVPIAGLALAGAGLLALALAVALWTVREHQPLGGFVSAFLVLAGGALVAPAAAVGLETVAGPPLRRFAGIEAGLGARHLRESVARTSGVIASIMVAVGMLVALTVMVTSFRHTVDTWVRQTLRGDLYVEPVGHRLSGNATAIPLPLVREIAALPGVEAMDTYRSARIVHEGRIAYAVGIDFAVQQTRGQLEFIGADARTVLGRALAEDGVIVTESFAHRHGVAPGDSIALATPSGLTRLPVEGVFYDYSVDAGAVLMDRRLYARLWQDDRVESFALYLKPGTDPAAVRARLLELTAGRLVLHVMPNRQLRERVLTVFDQTFQITWALQAIAVLVSVLGVVSALTALVLQRAREIGVLRATGALRSQVRTMVLAESALLGLIGSALGCAVGLALALLLIHVINRQFFGWTIRLSLDPMVFVRAILLMIAASLAAGFVPARLAAGRLTSEALRME
jgi:putative ABC transport system permease protein